VKKLLLPFLVVGIAIATYLYFQKQDAPIANSPKSPAVSSEQPVAIKQDSNSRYQSYTPEALSQALAESKVVLFFYANWCPTCRPIDLELQNNLSKIPDDVTVIRVNYNDSDTDKEEKSLAQKYAITYQHTFVQIDNNGNEITKWNGGGLANLIANVK